MKFRVQVRLAFADDIYGPYNFVPGEHGKKILIMKPWARGKFKEVKFFLILSASLCTAPDCL